MINDIEIYIYVCLALVGICFLFCGLLHTCEKTLKPSVVKPIT